MRKLFYFLFILTCLQASGQTHQDSINLLRQTAALYDLDFTAAEADSMMDNINGFKAVYKGMHQQLPKNSLTYPFAFQPQTKDVIIPLNQEKINWEIPSNVSLPAN